MNSPDAVAPRRGFEFVTRKITSHAARIKLGPAHEVRPGNLDAKRDWGHAKEYVEAMWLMLQQETPNDYVIATGEAHSVMEFVETAFPYLGLDYCNYVKIDPELIQSADVDVLLGCAEKADQDLGWRPRIRFADLVTEMVEADLAASRDAL